MALRIGRYELIGSLGSGGMSSVSLARAPTGQVVVLKRQHLPDQDEALLHEARVGVRLSHPHIVETLDLFEHQGRPVLVVAYVSGPSLADLRVPGPMPPNLVARIGKQVASALAAIHSATEEDGTALQMLHRDVTPSNILIGHDGQARLIDLGIARSSLQTDDVTQEGVLKGTLRYLAPELLDEGVHSVSTDLWGLGLSLFEAALGRVAVDGEMPEVYAAIMSGNIIAVKPGEHLDLKLGGVLSQLLSVELKYRPPDATSAEREFQKVLGSQPDEPLRRATALLVERVVGPPAEIEQAADIHQRRLIVGRAAATYGGPAGDWRVFEDAPPRVGESSFGAAVHLEEPTDDWGDLSIAVTDPEGEADDPSEPTDPHNDRSATTDQRGSTSEPSDPHLEARPTVVTPEPRIAAGPAPGPSDVAQENLRTEIWEIPPTMPSDGYRPPPLGSSDPAGVGPLVAEAPSDADTVSLTDVHEPMLLSPADHRLLSAPAPAASALDERTLDGVPPRSATDDAPTPAPWTSGGSSALDEETIEPLHLDAPTPEPVPLDFPPPAPSHRQPTIPALVDLPPLGSPAGPWLGEDTSDVPESQSSGKSEAPFLPVDTVPTRGDPELSRKVKELHSRYLKDGSLDPFLGPPTDND